MDNLTKFTLKRRYGIDDLKGLYAYVGNSQGDHSGSNELHSDKESGGWMSFVFNCEETQEAINAEVKSRAIWNENYIEELKKSGKYGTEFEINMSFQRHPLFDDEKATERPTMTHSFFIMDMSKDKES